MKLIKPSKYITEAADEEMGGFGEEISMINDFLKADHPNHDEFDWDGTTLSVTFKDSEETKGFTRAELAELIDGFPAEKVYESIIKKPKKLKSKLLTEAASDYEDVEKFVDGMGESGFALSYLKAAGEDEAKVIFDAIEKDFFSDGTDIMDEAGLKRGKYIDNLIALVEMEYINYDELISYIIRVPSTSIVQANLEYIDRMQGILQESKTRNKKPSRKSKNPRMLKESADISDEDLKFIKDNMDTLMKGYVVTNKETGMSFDWDGNRFLVEYDDGSQHELTKDEVEQMGVILEVSGYTLKPKEKQMVQKLISSGGASVDTSGSSIGLEFEELSNGATLIKGFRQNLAIIDFKNMKFFLFGGSGNMSQTMLNFVSKVAKSQNLKFIDYVDSIKDVVNESSDRRPDTKKRKHPALQARSKKNVVKPKSRKRPPRKK